MGNQVSERTFITFDKGGNWRLLEPPEELKSGCKDAQVKFRNNSSSFDVKTHIQKHVVFIKFMSNWGILVEFIGVNLCGLSLFSRLFGCKFWIHS